MTDKPKKKPTNAEITRIITAMDGPPVSRENYMPQPKKPASAKKTKK